ncbi:alpha/beta fold hydrolase [Pelomonas sp. CA6]|uniref:alpha/beta fold hydrolase n=1 Tax=Pelomonas sp. CA6 TaxID=2907999 RepID=UPI001F4C36EA|nr:alpha/beta fold hydrolase [Pelomonas sp. CA6]MCH7343338.1 alpha/beta fold hydrolase [Pelomonas sp. CA6]
METLTLELPHGVSLACRVSGPPDAPRVVLLHGFPEGAFIWDGVMQRLGQRWRCIAPDLRGYGESSHPEAVEAYRAKHLVQDIVALIAATGPGPLAALVAHDWGGAVAWNLAAQRPGLLQRLVILNSPHPGTFLRELQLNPAQRAASAYMNELCRPDAEQRLMADDFARMWRFFTLMGEAPWLDEPLRERYRAHWRRGLNGALNYYRASPMRPPQAGDPGAMALEFAPGFVTVCVPTTVLWGMKDVALPPALLDGLERFVPRLTVHRVAQATHWIVHEQEALVAEMIGRALAEA